MESASESFPVHARNSSIAQKEKRPAFFKAGRHSFDYNAAIKDR
jgi:hypothetical protein